MGHCPSTHELRGLRDDSLPAEDRRRVESHVSRCRACRDALTRLESLIRDGYGRDADGTAGMGDGGSPPRRTMPLALPAVDGYENLKPLSTGGQGVVFEAVQSATKRKVAVKVLFEPFPSQEQLRRFEEEIECVASLRHPNIVTVYECRRTDDHRPFFSMEFVDGYPLDTYLRSEDVPLKTRLRMFVKIADAVAHAHRHGVIHRDIKPGNILIDGDEEPRVLDFGLAHHTVPERTAASARITRTGAFLGTLAYAAPEQFDGKPEHVNELTDVWGLGALLYEMLTDRQPFKMTGSPAEIERQIREATPPRPSSLRRGVDADLDTIVMRSLTKEPARRYASAVDLAADVRRFLAGDPIEARRDSVTYRVRKRLRRYRLPLAVGCAFVILLAALGNYRQRVSATALEAQRIEARNLFNEARWIAPREPADAISMLDQAIEKDPTFVDAKLRRAMLYWNARDLPSAIRAAEAILPDHPDAVEAHVLLAKFYKQHDPAKAEFHRNQAVAGAPTSRLYAAQIEENDEAAVTMLNEILEFEGADFDALSERVLRREQLRDFDGMLQDADLMLKLQPRSSLAWTAKGLALEHLGRPSEALPCMDEALRISPHVAYAYLYRADTLCQLGRFSEAIDACNRSLERRPDAAKAYELRAWARWNRDGSQNTDLALADCNRAIELAPRTTLAHFCRAKILRQRWKDEEALADLSMAIQTDPDFVDGYAQRAWTYLDRYAPELAFLDANRTVELEPNSADHLDLRGQVHAALGHQQSALDDFNAAIHLDPAFARAYHSRGRLHRLMGRYEEALADFDRAAQLAREASMPYSGRAVTHRLVGDDAAALVDFRYALQYAERSQIPLLRVQLWEIHMLSGDAALAGEELGNAGGIPEARPEHALIVDYLAGRMSEDAFLSEVPMGGPECSVRCYYAGLAHLAAGRDADAAHWFTRCVEAGNTVDDEHELARMHLARLSEPLPGFQPQ